MRTRIQQVFREEFDLTAIDYQIYLSASSLARVFFRIRLADPNVVPDVDVSALEKRLQAATPLLGRGYRRRA